MESQSLYEMRIVLLIFCPPSSTPSRVFHWHHEALKGFVIHKLFKVTREDRERELKGRSAAHPKSIWYSMQVWYVLVHELVSNAIEDDDSVMKLHVASKHSTSRDGGVSRSIWENRLVVLSTIASKQATDSPNILGT